MENARYLHYIFTVNLTLSSYWTIWGMYKNEFILVICGIPFLVLAILGTYFNSKSLGKIEVEKANPEHSIRGRI